MKYRANLIFTFCLLVFSNTGLTQEISKLDSIQREIDLSTSLQNIENNPLKPPRTKSPQETLESFLSNLSRSYQILQIANEQNKKLPGININKAVQKNVANAELLFKRAVYCLDLSSFPNAVQNDIGYGRAIMLKEILDHIELPPFDSIPDIVAVTNDFETKKHPQLLSWRIPNTDIILVKQNEGQKKGQYLFSKETVDNIDEYYDAIEALPYKKRLEITPGFYQFYIGTPGLLMPPKWLIYLPDWSRKVFLSQTIWQWMAFILTSLILGICIWILYRLLIKRGQRTSNVKKNWTRVLFFALTIGSLSVYYTFLNESINISGLTLMILRIVVTTLSWMLFAFLSSNFLLGVAELILLSRRATIFSIESTSLRAGFGVVAVFVFLTIIIIGLSDVGVSLLPLVTGVGIGGLAIALAARSTIENVISSFTIMADKPYRLGHRIKILGYDGFVEAIGIRSTKIRLLNGHLVVIPNEKIATAEVENVSERNYLRRNFEIKLPYDTTSKKIEEVKSIIKSVLSIKDKSQGNFSFDNKSINNPNYLPKVFFGEIDTDTIIIKITYWFHPAEWWLYMEHADMINSEIIKQLADIGIELAKPKREIILTDTNSPSAP